MTKDKYKILCDEKERKKEIFFRGQRESLKMCYHWGNILTGYC